MDETGNHNSQETDTRTENQTLHVLTHRRVMNNENTRTQGEEHHTLGSFGSAKGGTARRWGGQVGITWGGMPDVGDWGVGDSKPYCHMCTNATILHDLHMYPRT